VKILRLLISIVASATVLLLASTRAYSIPTGIDDFEDGTTQGWTVGTGTIPPPVNPAPPVNVSTGGPTGAGDAFLQLTALGGEGPASRLSVMNISQWTGDYLAAGITGIAMDVNNFGPTELTLRLLLVNFSAIPGPPTDIAWTLSPVIVPAGSGWVSVEFDLSGVNLFAPVGTPAGALSDVNELRLFHNPDPAFGGPGVGAPPVVASLGIDNIRGVPESSPTLPLLLLGVGVVGVFAHVQRKRAIEVQ
jgi:hypothetical protein